MYYIVNRTLITVFFICTLIFRSLNFRQNKLLINFKCIPFGGLAIKFTYRILSGFALDNGAQSSCFGTLRAQYK